MSGAPAGPRQPRAVVTVNGAACAGMISWTAEETEFATPDTFEVIFALNGLPNDRDAKWWAETESAEIEIFVGEPNDPAAYSSGDLTSIFFGKADDVVADWTSSTLRVTGRDLTAPMIDTKTSEKYINKTASEIAETLAGKYGLTPKVKATTTRAGKLYADDHVELKDERTEWDLLTWLARVEGFVVFVRGKELFFQPKAEAGDVKPFTVKREAASSARTENGNYVSLSTSRSLMLAGDIRVTVKSWTIKSKKAYQRFAVRKGKGGGHKQEYSFTIHGLTPDEAQQRANKLLAEISKHEWKMSFSGAAVEDLHIDGQIALEGTGTAADQTYFPDSISRTFDAEDGFSWTVSAKNHPTVDEPTV